jgi:hypothetical protein
MKTKDLLYVHGELFNKVMVSNENTTDSIVCPDCDFQLNHKNHVLSVESAINKVIAHMLENH